MCTKAWTDCSDCVINIVSCFYNSFAFRLLLCKKLDRMALLHTYTHTVDYRIYELLQGNENRHKTLAILRRSASCG